MALKQHPDRESGLPSGQPPPWGVLAEKGEHAQVVRLVIGDRSVSYPFHVFKRWEFQPGPPETLTLAAGEEIVTVQGHGLAVVRDALDAGALRILRVKSGRFPAVPSDETVVTQITFTASLPLRKAPGAPAGDLG